MKTVFIGGSRSISRLPEEVEKRLANIVANGHRVVVGDADGVDKAAQNFFSARGYETVTVYCSGKKTRNNVGGWPVRAVEPDGNVRGFEFFAAKDRAMADTADAGLMIWDGQSPGTILNVIRLSLRDRVSVLHRLPDNLWINLRTAGELNDFLAHCTNKLLRDVEKRATAEEWRIVTPPARADLLRADASDAARELENLNTALATAELTAIVESIGRMARQKGMSRVARETGLARESLYRALDTNGNPEFATVLKVLASFGLRIEARSASD